MKPGEHPDFFRLPAPEGRSRESTIVLDGEGRFFHEGAPVTHPGMAKAFASWIARHPDDGRYILSNGYDWSYFQVEDVPFFVLRVLLPGAEGGSAAPQIELSDGTIEALDPDRLWLGPRDALYADVKGGAFQARFTRSAQLGLAGLLVEADGGVFFDFAGIRRAIPITPRKA